MKSSSFRGPIEEISPFCWRIPRSYKATMRVDGMVFASAEMVTRLRQDQALEQVANVATLPGIQKASLAMPDIHWGYGFCIGGVCATDPAAGGVISPGGVGYDINCGVRLIRSRLTETDVRPELPRLMKSLFQAIPAGVGEKGSFSFTREELAKLLASGVSFLVSRGEATKRDRDFTEARGCLEGADPDAVSDRAYLRGMGQCGTLGSGNHFAEVQVVDTIFDEPTARVLGLFQGQVCVMIHSGSRGLGYQVCDDTLRLLRNVPQRYGIALPDQQLACAPIESSEGKQYLGAMRAAANYAWCNRQLLTHLVRKSFSKHFGTHWQSLEMELVYDVAHNIAKFEEHRIGEETRRVCVHRKGATRAFPPHHRELPEDYREIGQPVLIPGDMGTASYVLVGRSSSMDLSFGTTCHGAGRALSRTASVRAAAGRDIAKELAARGVVALARSRRGLAEEQPDAYKNVDDVVEVVHSVGLSAKVARLRPIGVIKG